MVNGGLSRFGSLAAAVVAAPLGALAILLAYRTNPAVPLAALLGVGVVLLAYFRPLAGVLLALALVPLEVFAFTLGPVGLGPSEAVFVVTGYAWAAKRLGAGLTPWAASPISRPIALLWVAGLPGVLVAEDPVSTIRFLVVWGAFILVMMLIAVEADLAAVRTLLFGLAMTAAVVGATAAVGVSGQQQELSATGDTATGRAGGAFGDPNILATFLAMALPAALLVAVGGRWRRRPLAIVAVGVIFVGLALSLSRGGFLAALGALLVMLGWAPLRRIAAAAAVGLVLLTVLNANPLAGTQQVRTVVNRVSSVRQQSGSQTDQRALIYSETPRMIADYWVTGVGALNYPNVAPRYGIIDPQTGETFDHAHNIALTIGAEFGFLGLIALAWLVIALARVLAAACRRRPGRPRELGFAVTGALVALGLQGLVDFTLRSNIIAAVTFIILGALVAITRAAQAAEAAAGALRSGG
jgi:O-antigen ligase